MSSVNNMKRLDIGPVWELLAPTYGLLITLVKKLGRKTSCEAHWCGNVKLNESSDNFCFN